MRTSVVSISENIFKVPERLLITVLLIIFSSALAQSQTMYEVKYKSQAGILLYEVDYANQTDIKYFEVDYRSQVNKELNRWFRVDYPSQAEFKIYWLEYVYLKYAIRANLKEKKTKNRMLLF